jgi:hypothetical protein
MGSPRLRITIGEVAIGISLCLIVATVVWITYSPKAQARRFETQIWKDLRQIGMAYNVYVEDHGGRLPLSWTDLPGTPRRLVGWKSGSSYERDGSRIGGSSGSYTLLNTYYSEAIVNTYPVKYRYDPNKYGVAKAPQIVWDKGEKIPLETVCLDDKGKPYRLAQNYSVWRFLTVFPDGSIRWSYESRVWENEQAIWSGIKLKP